MMSRKATSFLGIDNLKALNDLDLDSLRGPFGQTPVIINDQEPLAKAIRDQTRVSIDIDQGEMRAMIQKGNSRTIKRQNRYRF